MASLWAKYLAERDRKEVLEAEYGFAVFSFQDPRVCYLEELFVDTNYRKTGLSVELAQAVEKIAIERGAICLTGSVRVTNDPKESKSAARVIRGLIAYGMEPYELNEASRLLFFRKLLSTSSEGSN